MARRASITIKAPTDDGGDAGGGGGGGGGFAPVPFEAGSARRCVPWAERPKDSLTASLRSLLLQSVAAGDEGVLDGALAAARDAQYEAVVDATLQCVGRVQQGRRREREAMQRLKAAHAAWRGRALLQARLPDLESELVVAASRRVRDADDAHASAAAAALKAALPPALEELRASLAHATLAKAAGDRRKSVAAPDRRKSAGRVVASVPSLVRRWEAEVRAPPPRCAATTRASFPIGSSPRPIAQSRRRSARGSEAARRAGRRGPPPPPRGRRRRRRRIESPRR